jgi:hypothetical protein
LTSSKDQTWQLWTLKNEKRYKPKGCILYVIKQ